MSKGWDNATLKKLKNLIGKGFSTSEIGKELGVSKNAVVGKLNRLGWNSKAMAGATDAPKLPSATKKATAKAPVSKKTTATQSGGKSVKKPTAETKKTAPKATVVKKNTPEKLPDAKVSKKATDQVTDAPKETLDKKSMNKNLAMHQRIIQHSLEMASLKPNQCRWPIGDPDSEHFHFCGETVFVGKPYCYEHCKQAYQFAPPKKK